MAAGIIDILIEQGATFERTINVKDSDGVAINLSDVTSVVGQVRKLYSANTAYDFDLSVTSAVSGVISWEMDAVTTASIPVIGNEQYVYDVEVLRGANVQRLLQGIAIINPEVTRT
jgi:hypothetical protein